MRSIPPPVSGISWLLILASFPSFLFSQVRTGAEQTELYYPLISGKEIAVVANQASVVRDSNIVDMLHHRGIRISRIFSPEHGFRLSAEDGKFIGNSIDPATGIRVVSLYGNKVKPAPEDLRSVDLVLFDIQDVGVRFYTYLSTLSYVMEACAESGIPMIVLDRPDPNGFYIDGPVLEKQFRSFVGMHPVPVVYGMTIGEYARMVNGEGWLKNRIKCDLRIIPLAGYTHNTRYVIPVRPSPNLPDANAVLLYPSLCLFEGTKISVGRGTDFPFEVYGNPDLNYASFTFTPRSIPGVSDHPLFEGQECRGEDLREYYKNNPADSGRIVLQWIIKCYREWTDKTTYFSGYFNKLAGNSKLQQQISQGRSESEIRRSWEAGLNKFRKIREKYLLY